MAAEPSPMLEFLMRTVHKLEAELEQKNARIKDLEAFMESQRDFYTESGDECTRYFDLLDGPREGDK